MTRRIGSFLRRILVALAAGLGLLLVAASVAAEVAANIG